MRSLLDGLRRGQLFNFIGRLFNFFLISEKEKTVAGKEAIPHSAVGIPLNRNIDKLDLRNAGL
jgi:hypothetical protein